MALSSADVTSMQATLTEHFIHRVVIERSTDGPVDEYNNPTQVWATLAVVDAIIQPKTGRELLQTNEAGPRSGEFIVSMLPTDVTEGDHLIRQDQPEIYEIGFVADAGGLGVNYVLDCTRVWPNG